MKLRTAAAFAIASTLVLAALPAAAQQGEGRRPIGLRFETQVNPFNLVGITDGVGGNPHGDIKIGYDLPMGLTPLIGIGYRSNSTSLDLDGEIENEESNSAFVVAVELRYYLLQHRRGLQPFVFGEFNTSFVSFDDELDTTTDDDLEEQGDLADHTEINLGLGMEYKFSRAFAIGGKWGLAFGFKGATSAADEDNSSNDTTWGTSQGVYLAWRI